MVHREPTSSGSMYTAQTESKEETVREESMRMNEKVMLTYRKYLIIMCGIYTYVRFFPGIYLLLVAEVLSGL